MNRDQAIFKYGQFIIDLAMQIHRKESGKSFWLDLSKDEREHYYLRALNSKRG